MAEFLTTPRRTSKLFFWGVRMVPGEGSTSYGPGVRFSGTPLFLRGQL